MMWYPVKFEAGENTLTAAYFPTKAIGLEVQLNDYHDEYHPSTSISIMSKLPFAKCLTCISSLY